MIRRRPFRDVRSRLLLIVLAALTVALGVATLGFNVLFARTSSNAADSVLRQRAQAERALFRFEGSRLTIAETEDVSLKDGHVWIYRGTRALEAPAARAATVRAVRSLVGGPARYVTVASTDERLYAAPILDPAGRRAGTVVTGISLAPYEETQQTALVASFVFAATLLLIVGIAVWWLLRYALRPVEQMTAQAAAWSERDLDRRFSLGEPHDELTRLGATLDNLLDRIAASLRHERRFSAELSHELRTPLSKVIAEAELALRRERTSAEYREALEATLRNAQQVARIVDPLVAAAQQEAATSRGLSDAYAVVRDAIDGMTSEGSGAPELVADPPPRALRLGVDADLAERVLQPVLDNACRYGRSRVTVELDRRGTRVVYRVEDDGPGVTEEEREAIFEPGIRGSAGAGSAGAGLGLALARRLARAVSGDVEVEQNGAGACFVVSLPTG
jgi:two-component system OmpR family sensor kinase